MQQIEAAASRGKKNIGRLTPPPWPCSHEADTEDELLRRANLRGLLVVGEERAVVRRFYGRTRRSPESASTLLQLELSED